MQKKNFIPVILLSLSCILLLTAVILLLNSNSSFKNNTLKNDTNSNGTKEEITSTDNNKEENSNQDNSNSNSNIEDSKEVDTSNKDENVTKPSVSNSNTTSSSNSSTNSNTNTNTNSSNSNKDTSSSTTNKPTQSTDNQVEVSKSENSLISYFKNQEISTFSNVDQDDRTIREKAKDAFVGIVDFIFYDKEVKGYTFKGLTTSAKLQIIKIALSIDSKIDSYFPDYKEVMKDKYSNIKGKLAVKYLEFTSSLCENVGEETCNQAKEDFNKMKESFGFTWQLIKELASSGSTKVKDFYESWRDSE